MIKDQEYEPITFWKKREAFWGNVRLVKFHFYGREGQRVMGSPEAGCFFDGAYYVIFSYFDSVGVVRNNQGQKLLCVVKEAGWNGPMGDFAKDNGFNNIVYQSLNDMTSTEIEKVEQFISKTFAKGLFKNKKEAVLNKLDIAVIDGVSR